MYEIAILLSDRPKSLNAQMFTGNFALLLADEVFATRHFY